tara:strand:+ start:260 stop:538 length:279 start_codon:yes stop_codon:yes gene_type:complete
MNITYAKAVFSIKENADFTISNDDLDNIVWHDDNPTNITKEQILAKQTELQTVEDAKPENTAKASGNTKLLDLGLSQEEATALTGYTPPVAE